MPRVVQITLYDDGPQLGAMVDDQPVTVDAKTWHRLLRTAADLADRDDLNEHPAIREQTLERLVATAKRELADRERALSEHRQHGLT